MGTGTGPWTTFGVSAETRINAHACKPESADTKLWPLEKPAGVSPALPLGALTMVRVGIVGSRFAANLHALGLRQSSGAGLIAAASPNAEDAWEFHRRFEIPHVFKDYKDMLDSGFVDAITIACPNDLHCEVTLAAAAAGKHVFVDKPMALNPAERDRMIEACRQAGVVLMYGENLCFAPKYVRAKEQATVSDIARDISVPGWNCSLISDAPWMDFDSTCSIPVM